MTQNPILPRSPLSFSLAVPNAEHSWISAECGANVALRSRGISRDLAPGIAAAIFAAATTTTDNGAVISRAHVTRTRRA